MEERETSGIDSTLGLFEGPSSLGPRLAFLAALRMMWRGGGTQSLTRSYCFPLVLSAWTFLALLLKPSRLGPSWWIDKLGHNSWKKKSRVKTRQRNQRKNNKKILTIPIAVGFLEKGMSTKVLQCKALGNLWSMASSWSEGDMYTTSFVIYLLGEEVK